MSSYPISLKRHFFTHFNVESNPKHIEADLAKITEPDSEIRVDFSPDDDHVLVAYQFVRNASEDSPQPYIFDIRCFGIFVVEDSLPKEHRIEQVTLLAHTILYGAIREALLTATSRQAWGPYCLNLAVLRDDDSSSDNIINEELKSSKTAAKTKVMRKPATT